MCCKVGVGSRETGVDCGVKKNNGERFPPLFKLILPRGNSKVHLSFFDFYQFIA